MQIERADSFVSSLGLESYRVGGSVRDELLGRPAKDADYMIRGVPLIELGDRLRDRRADFDKYAVKPLTLRDGRQAGWRVSGKGLGVIEIVLPRTEIPREPMPGENRHRAFDIIVNPDVTLAQDAERRDFTFNALYKIVHEGQSSLVASDDGTLIESVMDPTGTGLYDLSRKLVRTTHPTSFMDDPLRTLRALRFVSTLGYDLATPTHEQMVENAEYVTGLSAKGYASGTVLTEMSKLLMGPDVARALRLARDTGVLGSLLPELGPMLGFDQGSRYHDLTTDEHTFKALETAAHVDAPLRVRWALLFHDSGKPDVAWVGKDGRKHYYSTKLVREDSPGEWTTTEDHEVAGERIWRGAANRLSADRKLRDDVAVLIRDHMVPTKTKNAGSRVRRMRVKYGDELLHDLLLHRVCDLSGKGEKVALNHIEHIVKLESLRGAAEQDKVPCSVKDLKINGHDVAEFTGYGRQVGETLARVLDEVVVDPSEQKLTREWQLQRAEALQRR